MNTNSNHSAYSRKKFIKAKNRAEGPGEKILNYGSYNQINELRNLSVIDEKSHLYLSKTRELDAVQDQKQNELEFEGNYKIHSYEVIDCSDINLWFIKNNKRDRRRNNMSRGGLMAKKSGLDASKHVKRPSQYQGICVNTERQISFYKLNGIASPGVEDVTPPLFADFNEKLRNILLFN